jgi:hypothetical protein
LLVTIGEAITRKTSVSSLHDYKLYGLSHPSPFSASVGFQRERICLTAEWRQIAQRLPNARSDLVGEERSLLKHRTQNHQSPAVRRPLFIIC